MQQVEVVQVPTPPQPPAAPGITVTMGGAAASPRLRFLAEEARREQLSDLMTRLVNRREGLIQELQQSPGEASRVALESNLAEVTKSINAMEQRISEADLALATAAGTPGSTVPAPHERERDRDRDDGPPVAMLVIGTVFAGISMVILAFSYARRLWKGASSGAAAIPAQLEQRFSRFEQSIDAVAIEVERVSEGQRFLTRVFADPSNRQAFGTGAGAAGEQRLGERMPEPVRRP